MKKLFYYLLPLVGAGWLTLLGGCDKDPKTTITVQEYGTKTPISGATVTLGDCDSDPSSGNVNCTATLSGITDANGQFKTDETAFAAAASAEGYWKSGDDFIVINAASGLSQVPNLIYLYPHAWLEVTVKNESGAYMITVPGDDPVGADKKVFLSKNEQESFLIKTRGNIKYVYVFSIWDLPVYTPKDWNSVKVAYTDGTSIPLEPNLFYFVPKGHETTKITITY